MNNRITIRSHQVEAFVGLIDEGVVSDERRQKYGDEMAGVFQRMIDIMQANPNALVFVITQENNVCRESCANRTEGCDLKKSETVRAELQEHVRFFGRPPVLTGYTMDELRQAVARYHNR